MSLTSRFERCKTPSGSIPISVIMGFDYPLSEQGSGRGETGYYSDLNRSLNSSYQRSSNFDSKYQSNTYRTSTFDNNANSSTLLSSTWNSDRGYGWPSSLSSREDAENMSRSRYIRAQTEARETLRSARERYVQCSDPKEHPKQQPCRYPTALS